MAIITDPDWIDPEETTFDVEKPIRSEQGIMLAGNPIAIALGKPGAPRIVPGALAIYLGEVATSGSTAAGLSDMSGIDVITFISGGGVGAGYGDASFRASTDNGATWGGWMTLGQVGTGNVIFFDCCIALQSGWWTSRGVRAGSDGLPARIQDGGTFTPGGTVNAVQFRSVGSIRVFGLGAGA